MTNVYGPYVPSVLIKKYIVMWLSKDEDRAQEQAAWCCGLDARAIYRVMHGESETVRFVTADKILLGLGYEMAWYQDPELSPIYAAA